MGGERNLPAFFHLPADAAKRRLLCRWSRASPASTTAAAGPIAALVTCLTDRLLCTALGEHGDPVLDDFRCPAVNFYLGERLAEDAAMCQCALRPHAGGQVTEPALQHENLSQTLEIATRQGQTSKPRQWLSRASIIVASR